MVFAQSEFLEMAEEPIADPITGAKIELADDRWQPAQRTTARRLGKRQRYGRDDQRSGDRQRDFRCDDHGDAGARQKLRARIVFRFNANVAAAHPRRDASRNCSAPVMPAQSSKAFTLRQPPLTYVSAANAERRGVDARSAGQRSAVARGPTLYAARRRGAHLRHAGATTTARRPCNSATASTGARLPSGQNNVRGRVSQGHRPRRAGQRRAAEHAADRARSASKA